MFTFTELCLNTGRDVHSNDARSINTLNDRLCYRLSRNLRVEREGFNLASRKDSATDNNYASRLRNEPAAVGGNHFHPIESRSFRVNVTVNF